MDLHLALQYVTVTATVIGYFVIAGWLLTLVWFFSKVVGEFRFNRLLKRRHDHEFDLVRSSWLAETRAPDPSNFDTAEIPQFDFRPEDDIPTEETGLVFDIQERYYQ